MTLYGSYGILNQKGFIMTEHIIKDLGTKQVGNRTHRFAIVKCPKCGKLEERRVRKDCNPQCRECAMKQIRSHIPKEIHGDTVKSSTYHRLYNIWRGMNRRCHDVNSNGYNQYGAKGVTVCEEWRNSYVKFKEWALSNGYQSHLTIDKDELCELQNISPKIYSPSTCKWRTIEDNASNNLRITTEDAKQLAILLETTSITPEELASQCGVSPKTILSRTRPYRTKKYVNKSVTAKG